MAPRTKKAATAPATLPQPFFQYLWDFYSANRSTIRSNYRKLTLKFLDHNDPGTGDGKTQGWLRKPQYEALEMYVFLKEYCNNQDLATLFGQWAASEGKFTGRQSIDGAVQTTMFEASEERKAELQAMYDEALKSLNDFRQAYSNYIFALTMGLGKTVLMATTIFYEFLLANKWPTDTRYCHNVLVFAPDKTVLQSLKEISTMDKGRVVPAEYVTWLEANVKFHFLDDSGASLNLLDRSKYNIVVSNTQKIILKKKKKADGGAEHLFKAEANLHQIKSINAEFMDLYDFDEADLTTNQRFEKLLRLEQLGIYVDEAHHVFGANLAKDLGVMKATTSLRLTINELAKHISDAGSRVVGCYNYTGTPYVGKQILPEVVYAFGLKESIDNRYLKKSSVSAFSNTKSAEFLQLVIREFWVQLSDKRVEGMLPKMAIFATTIEELTTEVRPAVEEVLISLGIPTSKILVNVGDDSVTTNDDLREFRQLDTPASDKQFILLVNKGKEGWNCRSLFSVALHREPKSKIFVLQAAMRCLRAVGDRQHTGYIYLSQENLRHLESELEENFRISLDSFQSAGADSEAVEVRPVPPPVEIVVKRIHKMHKLVEKDLKHHVKLGLDEVDQERYQVIRTDKDLVNIDKAGREQTLDSTSQCAFSAYSLTAEVARYLNRKPSEVRQVLEGSEEGMERILELVNFHNAILFDHVIPKLFQSLYEIKEYEGEEEERVYLVKDPGEGKCYTVHAKKDLILKLDDLGTSENTKKSFHVDAYCFDSNPEKELFWKLLGEEKVQKVWFTGMLTHGQSDFYINYIDPVSNTVRSYYPDFLVRDTHNRYTLIEVKADFQINDPVVQAKKAWAEQLARRNGWMYHMVAASEVDSIQVQKMLN